VTLKFGYKASAEQFGPRDLVEYAVLAEEVGLDSVWISDHFQPWRHEGGHAPSALPWLAAVGERTSRVLLGTSVLTPTFRYNPAVLAQSFATLGSLYPGRIALGVGSGEALNEIAVGSVPAGPDGGEGAWPEFKERSARLRESIRLMRQLWTEDRVTFDGEYYHAKDATIYDKPGRPIPVYMAAGGPVMAKSVGRIADGFICTSGKGEELYTSLQSAVDEGAEGAGRDAAEIDRMIEIKLSYAHTREEALENTRFWAALSLTAEQKHSVHDPSEMQRLADELPIEQVAKRWIVATTPEEVVAGIDRMIEIKLSYAPTREEALENTRFWAALSLTAEQKHSVHDPAEMQRLADELPIEQVAQRWIVATSVEEVVAGVRPYLDHGFDHLVFHPPGHDQGAFLRGFAAEVLPALKELG